MTDKSKKCCKSKTISKSDFIPNDFNTSGNVVTFSNIGTDDFGRKIYKKFGQNCDFKLQPINFICPFGIMNNPYDENYKIQITQDENNNNISKIQILKSGKYSIQYNTTLKLTVSTADIRTKRFDGQINYRVYLDIYTNNQNIIRSNNNNYMLILENFQEVFTEPEISEVLVIDLNEGDTIALCLDVVSASDSISEASEFTSSIYFSNNIDKTGNPFKQYNNTILQIEKIQN